MTTIPIIPVEMSADSKKNAYYVRCTPAETSRPYAVCLHLVAERKHGRLKDIYADCSAIIGKKQCPAIKMRADEVAANRALYFVERHQSAVTTCERVKAVFASVGNKFKSALTPQKLEVPKPVVKLREEPNDYAAAINAHLAKKRELAEVPAVTVAQRPAAGLDRKPGESLLDAARRLIQSK